MYPQTIFLDMDLYSILMMVGIIACMVCIRVLSDRRGMSAKWQNLVLVNILVTVMAGYGSAVLFQAFYNYMESGVFEITNSTGATFYGGLIGGTATFILIYFVVGHFLFRDGYHTRHFRMLSDMAPACIAIAHGFGRLGCLMAGCCHGPETDAWYGIVMNGVKRVPVQLFEAIFLLALGSILFCLFWHKKRYLMPLYMLSYGIWRFIAEYLRADHRGETIVSFWTPSQLISVLLLIGSVVLFVVEVCIDRKASPSEAEMTEEYVEEITEEATEEVTEEVTEEATEEVTEEVTEDASQATQDEESAP